MNQLDQILSPHTLVHLLGTLVIGALGAGAAFLGGKAALQEIRLDLRGKRAPGRWSGCTGRTSV
ncbi:hypothetical protein [Nocardiopsis potens]|uniref:hypothetical protein n=1 Tax=Nocardiopsis potens TaxID=1246458 RepID=UPI000348D7B8|nr:hypothetical protein [Nocardiopsis potens]